MSTWVMALVALACPGLLLAGCAKPVTYEPPAVEGARADGAEPVPPEPVELPLDGGTFTWTTGVSMTMDIELVESWGTRDDYCGDGSCGISQPDDTRLVLRYTISVPEDFGNTLDARGCPGELHSLNGNDEDALIAVAGEYAKTLEEVRPGGTKYGTVEYSVAKQYVNEELYLTSDCGAVFPMTDTEFGALSEDERTRVLQDYEGSQREVIFSGRIADAAGDMG